MQDSVRGDKNQPKKITSYSEWLETQPADPRAKKWKTQSGRGVAANNKAVNCPVCHSGDWRLASLIHAEGISKFSAQTGGVVVGTFGVGAGAGNTHGLQQTELSKRAAPPSPPGDTSSSYALGLLMALIGLMFLWSGILAPSNAWQILVGIALLILSWISFMIGRENSGKADQYSRDVERWKTRKMCMRCGHFYDDPTKEEVETKKEAGTIRQYISSTLRSTDSCGAKFTKYEQTQQNIEESSRQNPSPYDDEQARRSRIIHEIGESESALRLKESEEMLDAGGARNDQEINEREVLYRQLEKLEKTEEIRGYSAEALLAKDEHEKAMRRIELEHEDIMQRIEDKYESEFLLLDKELQESLDMSEEELKQRKLNRLENRRKKRVQEAGIFRDTQEDAASYLKDEKLNKAENMHGTADYDMEILEIKDEFELEKRRVYARHEDAIKRTDEWYKREIAK